MPPGPPCIILLLLELDVRVVLAESVPAEPEYVVRSRVLVTEKSVPAEFFQLMTSGMDDRSLLVKVTSKLDESSEARLPTAYSG
jgi:hypothetical protein